MEKKTSTGRALVRDMYNDGGYKSRNLGWHVEDSPWKANQIDKIISRNRIELSSVCEVGCGAGEILRQLSLKQRYKNVQFTGYEVSMDAFQLCKQRASDKVTFLLKDILEDEVSFDAILCVDVFELVENYMGFLRILRGKAHYKIFHIPLDLSVSALIQNKLLAGRMSVGHLHYFTPDTAIATLRDCGYSIIDTMYTPFFADLPAETLKKKIANFSRHILYRISPKLMSTLIGGCSLMVLAE